jgi:hypothetical protein
VSGLSPLLAKDDAGPLYKKIQKSLEASNRRGQSIWTLDGLDKDAEAVLKDLESASKLPAVLYESPKSTDRSAIWNSSEMLLSVWLSNLRGQLVLSEKYRDAERVVALEARYRDQMTVGDSPADRQATGWAPTRAYPTSDMPMLGSEKARKWHIRFQENLDFSSSVKAELSQVALSARRWLKEEAPPPPPPMAIPGYVIMTSSGVVTSRASSGALTRLAPVPAAKLPRPPAWRAWAQRHPFFFKVAELALLRSLRAMAEETLSKPGLIVDYHSCLLAHLDKDGSWPATWAKTRQSSASPHFVTSRVRGADIDRRIALMRMDLAERPKEQANPRLTWSAKFAVDPITAEPMKIRFANGMLSVYGPDWVRNVYGMGYYGGGVYPVRTTKVHVLHSPPRLIKKPKKTGVR